MAGKLHAWSQRLNQLSNLIARAMGRGGAGAAGAAAAGVGANLLAPDGGRGQPPPGGLHNPLLNPAAAAGDEEGAQGKEIEDEDLEQVALYAQYRPSKVKGGRPHPDPIVESASLASIQPPEPTCDHLLQVGAG